jgi:anti-sigma factor RsiW
MIGPCKEMQEHLAAYVDKQIEDEARAMVQAHVEQCLACRAEIEAQITLKRQLQTLKRRESRTTPAPKIWANAVAEWDRRDGARRRRYQLRYAVMACCMLLLLFGAVWAKWVAVHDFPVDAVMRDFRHARKAEVKPAYPTTDTDKARNYLNQQLGVEIPPLNLSLSQSQLVGVDLIPIANTRCARLLYRTPHGLIGLYVSPSGTQFPDLLTQSVEGESFFLDAKNKDVGLYGWTAGRVGYGLVAVKPLDAVKNVLLDAARSTQQPGP